MTSRRLLVVVLLLALGLTSCGRSTPRVVAEDGRGGDRPSGTIWIPETRDVDPGPDGRARDEDPDRPERSDRRSRSKDTNSTSPEDGTDDATRHEAQPAGGEEQAASRQTPNRAAPSSDEPSSPDTSARSPERQPRTAPTSDTPPKEPVEPESVGGCGQGRDQHQPSREELEQAAEALREEVADRWPQTHGGVWVTDGARPEVRVAFTERVRENLQKLCDGFAYPDRLGGDRVTLSAQELERIHDRMIEERDELRDGEGPDDLPEVIRATEGRYLVVVDLPSNALVVVIEQPTAELQQALRDRYTVQLRVEQGTVEEDHPDGSSPSRTHEQETA